MTFPVWRKYIKARKIFEKEEWVVRLINLYFFSRRASEISLAKIGEAEARIVLEQDSLCFSLISESWQFMEEGDY